MLAKIPIDIDYLFIRYDVILSIYIVHQIPLTHNYFPSVPTGELVALVDNG